MGFLRFAKSLFDSETMGEEIILNVQKIFKQTHEMSPHNDPHEILAKTWLSRMKARGLDINNESIALGSMTETYIFACVRPNANIRALALHLLFQERPDIIQQFPKFEEEYGRIMTPIFKAMENGTADQLYRKYNPHLAEEMD